MHGVPMAGFESQMAAQRSLMADSGLGMNAAQPDSMMHHHLAMAPNQHRKYLHYLPLFQDWSLSSLLLVAPLIWLTAGLEYFNQEIMILI